MRAGRSVMKLLKLSLFPFAFLYGLSVFFQKKLYDLGLFKRVSFKVPLICVGNMSTGGTGKSPHIEYLVRLLQDKHKVATLSRGYGRRSTGFILAKKKTTALEIGDEPAQFKQKFSDLPVAVGERRVNAVRRLMLEEPDTQVILLDDAYQHLNIQAGINMLLTTYDDLFVDDYLLPMGSLREFRRGYKRADIILITKSPHDMSPVNKRAWEERINAFPYQRVYFSHMDYGEIYEFDNPKAESSLSPEMSILLVCGIADPIQLKEWLEEKVASVEMMRFKDHHYFSGTDMSYIKSTFDKIEGDNKIILTTEKDAQRLAVRKDFIFEHELPIRVLPISVRFAEDDKEAFEDQIFEYLRSFVG